MQKWFEKIEEEYDIQILFACEAGSRAWGSASQQSDFDIRFIFKHRNIKSYLSISEPNKLIELSEPFDAVGWDLKKAFSLLEKSNPSLFEWAFSPVVYIDQSFFRDQLQKMIKLGYSPLVLSKHYFHLMKRNINSIKDKEPSLDSQKKLFYGYRAYMILKSLLRLKTVGEEVLTIPIEPEYQLYEILVKAKKEQILLPVHIVAEVVTVIKLEQEQLLEDISLLTNGTNIESSLNKWLWRLLDI